MPFYEYECRACGTQIEVLQKISEKPLRKCAQCGKSSLVKLVSAPIFRLKGAGWYETDFKSEQDKKRNLAIDKDDAKSDSATPEKSDAKAEAKSDTKTDTKSDTKSEAKSDAKAGSSSASKADVPSSRKSKSRSTRTATPRKAK